MSRRSSRSIKRGPSSSYRGFSWRHQNIQTEASSLQRSQSQKLSAKFAEQTGKPEDYVTTLLETDVPMTFAGSPAPAAFVEVKSIGALYPPAMTAAFCELITSRTGIPADRIYICFEDVPASSLGWNGRTFGWRIFRLLYFPPLWKPSESLACISTSPLPGKLRAFSIKHHW